MATAVLSSLIGPHSGRSLVRLTAAGAKSEVLPIVDSSEVRDIIFPGELRSPGERVRLHSRLYLLRCDDAACDQFIST